MVTEEEKNLFILQISINKAGIPFFELCFSKLIGSYVAEIPRNTHGIRVTLPDVRACYVTFLCSETFVSVHVMRWTYTGNELFSERAKYYQR